MNRFSFWQKWLLASSLCFVLYGVLLALWPDAGIFECYNRALYSKLLIEDVPSTGADQLRRFLAGPLGGTIAACYLLTAWLAYRPFRNREKWSRNAIFISYALWFLIDSFVAYKSKVLFHVLYINLPSLLIKMMPLIFTARYFKKQASENLGSNS